MSQFYGVNLPTYLLQIDIHRGYFLTSGVRISSITMGPIKFVRVDDPRFTLLIIRPFTPKIRANLKNLYFMIYAYAICSTKIFLAGQKNIWLAKTFWTFIFIQDFDGFGWPNLFWLVKIEFWPAKKILVEQMAQALNSVKKKGKNKSNKLQ